MLYFGFYAAFGNYRYGNLYGGASISGGIGLKRLCRLKVFSCLGDSTFHSGITGLIDVVYNQTDLKIVILDNRTTAMTGHQDNPGTGGKLCREKVYLR